MTPKRHTPVIMTKLLLFAITLAGFMLTAVSATRAQAIRRAGGYKRPVQLKLDGGLEERFYPIGWSGDGKFAYIMEPADIAKHDR